MRFQGGERFSDIALNTPWILWESVWNFVKTFWIICLLAALDHSLHLWIIWLAHELPVVQIKSIFLVQTSKCFISFSFSGWDVFHCAFWGYKTAGLYLINDVWKPVKLSDWLWLEDDAQLGINHLRISTTSEENWIKFTSKQIVNTFDFLQIFWVCAYLW